MRAVLDTNVVVAGLRSRRGASYRLLESLPSRLFTPLLSVPLMFEYEAVLKRERQRAAMALGMSDVESVLDMLAAASEHVRLYYLWRPLLPDPKDEMVIELAVTGRADAIVTFNARDFSAAAQRFGFAVTTPRDFWRRLKEDAA
jgi:putative PIN family toxin of toxin-antitoxin system